MAMLFNTDQPQNPDGFNPNINSSAIEVKATERQIKQWKVTRILCGILIFPFVWEKNWKNEYKTTQATVEQAASNIQIQEAKRADVLIKLLEQTKAYLQYEQQVFTNVTKLRSNANSANAVENSLQAEEISNEIQKQINIAFENYPELKANQIIRELMSSSQYLEEEIAAARRLYNSKAAAFNRSLFEYPRIVIAHQMGLTTYRLFQASEKQRQDVDMSTLSNSF